jgi:hypothetical protein
MPLITSTPAHRRRRTWALAGWGALTVAVAGLVALGRWPGVAVWVVLAGAVGAHWAGRRASDCAVLTRLTGVPLAQIAVPPARVRPTSPTPVADIARIRAAGCGVVEVDGVDRVLPAEHVDRYEVDVLLTGGWAHLAVPAAELDATVPVDLLARLPDEAEIWLVRTRIATLALGAAQLRAAAAGRRGATRPADSQGTATGRAVPHPLRRTVAGSRR